MYRLLLTAVMFMALAAPGQAQLPDSSWATRVAALYEGELVSDGQYAPVSTYFKIGHSPLPAGHYVFVEPSGKRIGGELTDCTPSPSLELACRWHDPYGSGRVVFMFAKDLRSFKGRWSDADQRAWYPWNGSKKD